MRGTTFAVAVLLFGVQAEAGVITQTVQISQQGPDAIYGFYNPLDPSLAPLNVASVALTVYGTGDTFELRNESLTDTINFNATLTGGLSFVDAGGPFFFYSVTNTVPITLGPGQSTEVTPIVILGPPGSQYLYVNTTNLNFYLDPGFTFTGQDIASLGIEDSVRVDNSMIQVFGPPPGEIEDRLTVTETLMYYYGSSTPEPASVVMMTIDLAVVAALGWRRL